ncbi:hypothetical protein DPMN_162552 [Dreissena polymorpha]|uniref:Uncharacterized protein n=1 Tax=Dreissena polymorpha TaxID=45954 RepID=A0A9D4EVA5_DREPO|nr:hypothetical protein DPMN_162552 [Dreissena polymorpha]
MDFRVSPEVKSQLRGIRFESKQELTVAAKRIVSSFDADCLDARLIRRRPSTLAQSCREDRCLCRVHGIEHPGQTDTFRSLSETELEPRHHRSRRCRNGSLALPELSSNWLTSPAEVTGHQKLYSTTDSETALNTRPVVSRGSASLQITRN